MVITVSTDEEEIMQNAVRNFIKRICYDYDPFVGVEIKGINCYLKFNCH